VPEFIDPRFRENKLKRSYSVIENERFGLVFAETGSIISGTEVQIRPLCDHEVNFTISTLQETQKTVFRLMPVATTKRLTTVFSIEMLSFSYTYLDTFLLNKIISRHLSSSIQFFKVEKNISRHFSSALFSLYPR
jgi:hypothetical protein